MVNALQMEKFDSLSGKIPIKPLYFGSKQHTSLEGEFRDYNNHKFYNTNFNGKYYYKLSLRIQTEYLRNLKVDKFFRVYKQRKRKRY